MEFKKKILLKRKSNHKNNQDIILVIFCASTYNSCRNCHGQCISNCLFGSCKERSAGNPNSMGCGTYGCYMGGCYLACMDRSQSSCNGQCGSDRDSMYTTCAGLATIVFLFT